MSTHPTRPSANQTPAVELRVLDPGGDHLALTWQIRNGYGHLLASGQVAGAPPQLGGWRYHAFTDAAHAAIAALQDLEATQRPPSPGEGDPDGSRARTCDFCAAAPAAWRYPVRGGRLAPVLVGEVLVIVPGGDWYACPACHHLVQAGQWDTLSARARLPGDQGAALWATFQAARAGTPTPLHQGRDDQDGAPADDRAHRSGQGTRSLAWRGRGRLPPLPRRHRHRRRPGPGCRAGRAPRCLPGRRRRLRWLRLRGRTPPPRRHVALWRLPRRTPARRPRQPTRTRPHPGPCRPGPAAARRAPGRHQRRARREGGRVNGGGFWRAQVLADLDGPRQLRLEGADR